jgi:hypothetical protein
MDQITVSRNSAGNFLAEISSSVKGLFDGFHREVGMSSVDDFEKGNLGISGKINILSSVSYELH